MSRQPFAFVLADGRVVAADVLEPYAVKAESRQLANQPLFESERGLVRPKYDPVALNSLLEASTAHYAACRQKAQDTAGLGWRFDKIDEAADDEAGELLEAFFDEMPPPRTATADDDLQNVFEAAALDYEAIGRGALELIRVDHAEVGPLETIVHMPAHTLRVARDGIRFLQSRGGKRRWFRWVGADVDVDYEAGTIHPLGSLRPARRATEIVWWRNPHPADLIYGVPDLIPGIGALVGDLGRRDYNLEFFKNWGIPAYAVFVTGDFDPGDTVDADGNPVEEGDPNGKSVLEWQIDRLLDQVRRNPHSTLVFTVPTREGVADGEVKIEFKPLATETKEASFRLYRKDNREEVLSTHRMSAAIAGVFEAGAANRESVKQYKRSVIAPRQRRLQRIVNRHIVRGAFGISGWRWRLTEIDTADVARDLELWLKLLDAGGVTLRQLLRHFARPLGLPDPGPDGDDPVLDRRRTPADPAEPAVEAALRSMRDDLVAMAAKSNGGGALPPWLARALA